MSICLRMGWSGILFAILLCGCASVSLTPTPQAAANTVRPHSTEIQAIRLAAQALERERRDLSRYRVPEVTRDGATWRVFFRGKLGIPGDHWIVLVDDRTGWVQIGRGA